MRVTHCASEEHGSKIHKMGWWTHIGLCRHLDQKLRPSAVLAPPPRPLCRSPRQQNALQIQRSAARRQVNLLLKLPNGPLRRRTCRRRRDAGRHARRWQNTGSGMRAKLELFGWEAQWSARQKSRDFDKKVNGIRAMARKVAGHLFSVECQSIADSLLHVVEILENRHMLFNAIRTLFWELISRSLSVHEQTVLHSAPQDLLASILTAELHRVMGSTVSLNQEFFAAFTACLTVSTSSESLTFTYLKDSPELVWAFQIQLVNSLMDKTWNRKYSQTIVNISEHMQKAMPYLPVDISSFNEKMEPRRHENQSWHPQALVSFSC